MPELLKKHSFPVLLHIDEFKESYANEPTKLLQMAVVLTKLGKSVSKDWYKTSLVYRLIKRTEKYECASCGAKAKYFGFAYHKNQHDVAVPMFVTECANTGRKSILTFDHVIPKSFGGSNSLTNGEVLCEHCNRTKSNNYTISEMIQVLQSENYISMIGFGEKSVAHKTIESLKNGPIKISKRAITVIA